MISTDNPLRGSDEHRLQKRYLLFLVSQVVLVVQSRFLQIMFQRLREASAAGDALWFCVLDMVLCRGRISTCIEKLVRVCVPGVISSVHPAHDSLGAQILPPIETCQFINFGFTADSSIVWACICSVVP